MSRGSIQTACGRLGSLLFTRELRLKKSIFVVVIGTFGIFGLLIFEAAKADHALRLPPPGRGLLNHYGFHACLISAPVVFLTVYTAVGYYLRLLSRIDIILTPDADQKHVAEIIAGHVRSLFLKDSWRGTLGFFVFIGAAVSIAIFRQLNDPVTFWGNDVFNAAHYRHGYIAANLFLFVTWSLIYPTAFYSAIRMTISIERIVNQIKKEGLLKLDFLHIDGCGGMAKFGALNFTIMLIYLGPFGALYALHLTHRNTYLSLVWGAITISVLFTVQSVYGVYWIAKAITRERETLITSLNSQIEDARNLSDGNSSIVLAKLAYRDCVLAVKSFPYSANISLAVNFLRFTPVIATIAKGMFWHR
jgi:hypothetical protein